ncbi:MAG TPA: SRPBCC family protein [Ignavibacteria bacterium]|nr:SRPBCC family protein [Ignavibacteria bacterium]
MLNKDASSPPKKIIVIEALIKAPIEKIWDNWTGPEHIVNWNNASDDWHTTRAENDLKVGGKFNSHMAAKDGSMGFDFEGVYTEVKKNECIEYILGDDRKVKIEFIKEGDKYRIREAFEAESSNPVEMQRDGWQAILDNFKKYTES